MERPTIGRWMSTDEADRIVAAAKTARERALFLLLRHTGGRVSEVAAVRPCDVDAAAGSVRLPTLKRRRPVERRVPVPVGVAEALLAFARDKRVPADAPLVGHGRGWAWKVVRRAGARAGVAPELCHPHSFRHAFGRGTLRALGDNPRALPIVQRVLGHASLTSTSIYLEAEECEVFAAFRSFLPIRTVPAAATA